MYANGALCGRLSFSDVRQQTADGGARLELGKAEQPAACRTDGAAVTLIDGRGFPIVDSTPPVTYPPAVKKYTLKPGSTIEIVDLSIPPATSGDAEPTATPAPPAAGSGVNTTATAAPVPPHWPWAARCAPSPYWPRVNRREAAPPLNNGLPRSPTVPLQTFLWSFCQHVWYRTRPAGRG